jgi:hypothetical protein
VILTSAYWHTSLFSPAPADISQFETHTHTTKNTTGASSAGDTAALLLQPHDNGQTAVLHDGEPVFFPERKFGCNGPQRTFVWDNQYYVVRLPSVNKITAHSTRLI